ncbi:GAF and ANTAR domain-containing protein [Streptacidiphilus monticola]|uniref:GAF and ANTAR domain-containing protein n=1 Tax=Streptacidiphilus monticola TaxID=2161674 RepID=A0ABW1FZH5_9ACTN
MSRQTIPGDVFASLTASLVGDFDLAEFLDQVARGCAQVCGADGIGIVVVDRSGVLRDVAYTDEAVRRLERRQVELAEGPCVDCVREGRPVSWPDLATADGRWPQIAPAAREAGFGSVHALPLRLHASPRGALNLFMHEPGQLAPGELATAQAFADLSMLGILQQQPGRSETAAGYVTRALEDRSVIERAKGILAETGDLSMDEAYQRLLDFARRADRRPTAVARDLSEGRLTGSAVLAHTAGDPER